MQSVADSILQNWWAIFGMIGITVLLLNIFYFIYFDSWPTHIVESSLENKATSSSYINKSHFMYPRRASWQHLPILAGFLASALTTGVMCLYANESARNQKNFHNQKNLFKWVVEYRFWILECVHLKLV